MFLRELYPDRRQLGTAFAQETKGLKKEAVEFLWKSTLEHWIDERTLDFSLDPDLDDKNVLGMGVDGLRAEIGQLEKAIEDLRLPPGMGDYDTAAFTHKYNNIKAQYRIKIRACLTIWERIRTRCLYYASRVEGQIQSQDRTSGFVERVQADVNNYYAARSEAVYSKLQKAASLIDSTDPEDHALLLTSIRRAVKAVADYHFPPTAETVVGPDGQPHQLGDEQYLNRLQQFCYERFPSSASSKLLRAELDYLNVFVKRVNDVASKGVHSEVTHVEARQGLLGLYMFLSNLIGKLDSVPEP
jgi:hypothetical protein